MTARVCVVRAPGQRLPPLDAIVVDDAVAHDGPLAALHAGLVALTGEADVAFACGVDTPLLAPAFVRAVLRSLHKGDDAVVPIIGGRSQPLLAAYRVRIAPRLRALLDDGAFGLRDIPRTSAVRQVGEWELISDPELDDADPRLTLRREREHAGGMGGASRSRDARLKPGVALRRSRPRRSRRASSRRRRGRR